MRSARTNMTDKQKVAALEREVRRQRAWITRLARALCTHTRTDLAPDAALPAMRRLVRELARR